MDIKNKTWTGYGLMLAAGLLLGVLLRSCVSCGGTAAQQTEGEDGWGDYLKLCSMGGMYGYFETLERAGIPNPLTPGTVEEAAGFVEKRIAELEEKIK